MKRTFPTLIATAVVALLACCAKKKEETGKSDPTKSQPFQKVPNPANGSGGTKGETTRKIANNYADDHWVIDEDPDNEWEQKFEAAATVEEKINVMGMKQSSGPEELAPLLRRALRHPNERLRIEAIQTTPIFINAKDDAVDIITGGVYDPSSEVRMLSMEMAREQMPETKLDIYKNTIRAPDLTVRKETAVELGRLLTKPAFEILIDGLNDPDPTFREAVNFEINLLVNQTFPSYGEAKQWWEDSSSKFDERMINIIE